MHILILTKKYTNIFFEKKNRNINKINPNISNLVFISPNKESRNIINASITQSRKTPSSISPKHKIKSLGPYWKVAIWFPWQVLFQIQHLLNRKESTFCAENDEHYNTVFFWSNAEKVKSLKAIQTTHVTTTKKKILHGKNQKIPESQLQIPLPYCFNLTLSLKKIRIWHQESPKQQ